MLQKFIQSALLLVVLFTTVQSYAQVSQAPDGIQFQALATDANGHPAAGRVIYVKDAIIAKTATGTIVYSETFKVTASSAGIFTIVLGKGTYAGGVSSIANIDWANGPFFLNLKIAVEPTVPTASWNVNNEYVDLGTSQFWSVPYALYAGSVKGLDTKLNIADTAAMLKPYFTAINLKANIESPTFTGTVSGITKAMVGLGNVDNTSDLNKPISTATKTALDLKANTADVTAAINLKANTADVNTALALKANTTDVNTALALKANTSDVTEALNLKANAADVINSLATKVDKVTGKELSTNDYTTAEKTKLAAITGTNTGDQDLSALAVAANVNAALALKANTADVNTALALKANSADVNASLALKANAANVASSLAAKADVVNVNNAIAAINTSLNTKADAVAVNNSIAVINNSLNTKADVVALNNAVATLNGTLATKENNSNKSVNITNDAASDTKYPSVKSVKTYVDAQVAGANIADADVNTKGKIQLAGDLAGTAAAPTVPGLALKENLTNKSTNVTNDAASDTKYPSVKSVKTYVDAQVAGANIADADANTKGKIQLAGDLAGTAAAPTVPGLALKENLTNKSTDVTTDAASDTKYPSVKSVKTYVDAQVAGATIADADANTKGKIQLAGDLGGTAAAPTVPGLTLKAPLASPTFTGTVTTDIINTGALSATSVTAPTYASAPKALSYSGSTINWDPAQGLNAAITLTQNSTLSFTAAPPVGSYGTVVLTQDATGNRTITLPSINGVANKVLGSASTSTVALSTAANAKDILNFYFDGTSCYWNIGQGYGTAATPVSTTTNLASSVTGTLPIANGGTGATTAAAGLTNLGAAPIASPTFTGSVTAPIYASTPQALTAGSTISWNPALGLNASVTLNQNSTLSFSTTPVAGSYGTVILTQDATGNRTITLPSINGVANKVLGSASTSTVVLSTAANSKDILNFYFDGTTCYWNIGQGYGTAASSSITNLATGVTGTLPVANGGTGATTLTGIVKGSGTSALTAAVAGTDYQAPITLTTTGTGAATLSGTTLTIPTYSLPIANITNLGGVKVGSNLNVDASGVLTANINAGTLTGTTLASNVVNSSLTSVGTLTSGTISLTTDIVTSGNLKAGAITYPNTAGTNGQVLTSNGAGNASWISPTTVSVGTISSTSNANGATITSGVLNLTPADETNGGIVTNGTQIFAGLKTFNDGINYIKVSSSPTLDQSNTTSNAGAGGTSQWQSFTAGVTGILSSVEWRMNTPLIPSAAAPVTIKIYNGEGNSGTLLATVNGSTPSDLIHVYVLFDLSSSNIKVISGQLYTIQLTTPTVQKGFLSLSTSNAYANGRASNDPNWDYMFKTNVRATSTDSYLPLTGGSLTGNLSTSGTITAGTVTYPNAHGTNGQVLTSTGSGTLTWTTSTADAGTLTGTTLNSTVTGSSLTSVGTLNSATVNGKVIVGASSAASASAVLEVSSTTQGFLPPRMTYAQKTAIVSPPQGLMIYCTNCGTNGEPEYFNGTSWVNMVGGTAASVPPPPLGSTYQGGKVFYIFQQGDPGYDANTPHGLIAAPSDIPYGTYKIFPSCYASYGTSTALGTGAANTTKILACTADNENAAKLVDALTDGGYSDWYLPSKDELNLLYLNRISAGNNFASNEYWSSSELYQWNYSSYDNAWYQFFTDGSQSTTGKGYQKGVRAIRSF
jgi:hypothetical protein